MKRYHKKLRVTHYFTADSVAYDYDMWEPVPGLECRGPAIDLSEPYIACLGAAQTFGRFVHRPFPLIMAEQLGIPVLNLGLGGVGPQFFIGEEWDWLANARVVLLQAMSGRSITCKAWDGQGHFCRVDGKPAVWLEMMKQLRDEDRIMPVKREAQRVYVQAYRQLIRQFRGKPRLFWSWSRRELTGNIGGWPHLVGEKVYNKVAAMCEDNACIVSDIGLPQTLPPGVMSTAKKLAENAGAATTNVKIGDEKDVNNYYPTPEIHTLIANELVPRVRKLLAPTPTGTVP